MNFLGHLFVFITVVSLCGCLSNSTNKNTTIGRDTTKAVVANAKTLQLNSNEQFGIDTSIYIIDSIIKDVNIKNGSFDFYFLSNKYDEHNKLIQHNIASPAIAQITVIVKQKSEAKILFKKTFPENEFSLFKNTGATNRPGNLFLLMTDFGGGSGFSSKIFLMTDKGGIDANEILTFGELSYFAFDKDDKNIILIDGIWSFNENENESHFSKHRYKVYTFKQNGNNYIKTKLGETKFKYSSWDDGESFKEILNEIRKREPELLTGVKIESYIFKEEQ